MTADHPVAVVEKEDWGDSYPSLREISPSIEGKFEAFTEYIVYGHIPLEVARANAKRLVACWNACVGMEDPEKEILSLLEGKDELG